MNRNKLEIICSRSFIHIRYDENGLSAYLWRRFCTDKDQQRSSILVIEYSQSFMEAMVRTQNLGCALGRAARIIEEQPGRTLRLIIVDTRQRMDCMQRIEAGGSGKCVVIASSVRCVRQAWKLQRNPRFAAQRAAGRMIRSHPHSIALFK